MSYSHLEIFICIYSVRGEIDQIATNTFSYTTCCTANVYMFVYILVLEHTFIYEGGPRGFIYIQSKGKGRFASSD